jgi:hypothetical protein
MNIFSEARSRHQETSFIYFSAEFQQGKEYVNPRHVRVIGKLSAEEIWHKRSNSPPHGNPPQRS